MSSSHHIIVLKRVYDVPTDDDGCRVLVDRLWPRGISRDKAKIDFWAKESAPSAELRKWFHADLDKRWKEFSVKYHDELASADAALDEIISVSAGRKLTLLYAARDEAHSHARVLAPVLEKRMQKK